MVHWAVAAIVADVIPLHDPTNYKRVHQRIKKLWDDGLMQILPHAHQRMAERAFDITDLQHVIRYGWITDHSQPGKHWRYVLEGKLLDGGRARCIVEINGHLLVVSLIRLMRRKGS